MTVTELNPANINSNLYNHNVQQFTDWYGTLGPEIQGQVHSLIMSRRRGFMVGDNSVGTEWLSDDVPRGIPFFVKVNWYLGRSYFT